MYFYQKSFLVRLNLYLIFPNTMKAFINFGFIIFLFALNTHALYINPLIFPHILKNPFTQEERQLPVEMNYPYTFRITNILEIPDIYRIEELPKSGKFTFSDNSISATYSVTHNENIINVNYAFALNQIFFQKESYKDLSNFFASIVNKNNELIILRKR